MYNLFIFLLLTLCLVAVPNPGRSSEQQAIFLVPNIPWNHKRFLKYGCPVITTEDEVYLRKNSDYIFIPQYSVLD
ncbi:hypothetical protein MTP99_006728, partial [Tenebrio molitor]